MKRDTGAFSIIDAKGKNLIGEMLSDARAAAGLSLVEVCHALAAYDLTITKSGLSRWERGERTPSAYQMMALCGVLDIPNPLDIYTDELNEAGLRKVSAFRNALIASGQYSAARVDYIDIRLYNVAVSAGTGSFLDSDDYELLRVPETAVPVGTDYALRVGGHSMEPVYQDGQIIWVHETETIRPGEVGIFSVDGESLVKLYRERIPEDTEIYIDAENVLHMQPVLVSFNPAFEPRVISPDSYFKVLGRVIS